MSVTNEFLVFAKQRGSTIWEHVGTFGNRDMAEGNALSQPASSRFVVIPCNELVNLALTALETANDITVFNGE